MCFRWRKLDVATVVGVCRYIYTECKKTVSILVLCECEKLRILKLFLGYQLFRILQIIIRVLDANDNTPNFQDEASVSVGEETSPGTVVFTAVARDPDAGQNGIVMYEIISGNEQGMCDFQRLFLTSTSSCFFSQCHQIHYLRVALTS